MKKIISILLTIGMLASLFVMPVSAAETSLFMVYPDNFILGASTALDSNNKVVFDEKGDSFSYTFELENAGVYKLAAFVSELGEVYKSDAYLRDAFVMNLYIDGHLLSVNLGNEVSKTDPGSYTAGRKPFNTLKLEAGRHTVKVENAFGSYKVDRVQMYQDDYCTEDRVDLTKFTTHSGINASCYFNEINRANTGLAAKMRQNMGDTISGVVAVPQDGIYDFKASVAGSYDAKNGTVNTFSVKLGGNVADFDFTFTDAEKTIYSDKTLMQGVSLAKGVYTFTITCTGSGNIQSWWDEVFLTKTGDASSFTYPTIVAKDLNTATETSLTSASHRLNEDFHRFGSNHHISYKFDVAQSGYYNVSFKSAYYYHATYYPTVYVDGICYYAGAVDLPGTDTSAYATANVVTEVGDVYLTAGEHIVKVQNTISNATLGPITFVGKAPVENAPIAIRTLGYDAETSGEIADPILGSSGRGHVITFADGNYAHYKVSAPANGFYNVGVEAVNVGNPINYAVSTNGTEAKGVFGGVDGSSWRTEALTGSVYLNVGMNDVLVRTTGANVQTAKFIFTPVALADVNLSLSAKASALYDAEENAATTIAANTEYTAVADIAGAYLGKPVTLMVGVYAGGKLVDAHSVKGTPVLGKTIENTFTTPAEAGDYTVKVFVFDGLSTLKPYTADVTVVNPAVAAE